MAKPKQSASFIH